MNKLLLIISFFLTPMFASDIQKCTNFKKESDCKYNESNNCTWISGEEKCVSKRRFNKTYNGRDTYRNYSGHHNKGRRKNRHR